MTKEDTGAVALLLLVVLVIITFCAVLDRRFDVMEHRLRMVERFSQSAK
jgi:uncharacterized membrane protein